VQAEVRIAAVVLAAGASRRFGAANKLLAPIGGETLIARTVDTLREAGVEDITVVTGWDRSAIEVALDGRCVCCVHNGEWERGMGGSIAAGIAAVNADASAAFIVPGDMALLTRVSVRRLIDAFREDGCGRIIVPTTRSGEQRNPVLWPRRHFGALKALPPTAGAKALLQALGDECRRVAIDDGELADIDTEADLAAAREWLGG